MDSKEHKDILLFFGNKDKALSDSEEEGESIMIKTIEERIKEHLPGRYEDTLSCYDMWRHEDWEDKAEDGELVGFISYFFLDFKFDMIITAAKDNKFSKAQWRVLRDTIKDRTKPLRIQSDPNNPILHRGAARLGGKFFEDEIWFKGPGESYA